MIFKYKVKSGGSRNLEQSIVITSSHRSRRGIPLVPKWVSKT